jgi:hypothetical protein
MAKPIWPKENAKKTEREKPGRLKEESPKGLKALEV